MGSDFTNYFIDLFLGAEVEKLKKDKAKLKLERDGSYINPGQRKVCIFSFFETGLNPGTAIIFNNL